MPEVGASPGEPGEGDKPKSRGAQILESLGRRGRGGFHSGPVAQVKGYAIPPDSKLGEGIASEVFRARDLTIPRDVALKILHKGEQPDEEQQERMETEAHALARLQGTKAGSHVVEIYNRVRTADGRHCLVLELVEGRSLADRLKKGGPLPALEAAALVRTIAEVVQAVHELRIIHRDLKPSNILLAADGRPKLTDFGLARFADYPGGRTLDGQILGTPEYMPPEQAAGRIAQVDESSDLYSIGAILYECLTGTPPFRGPHLTETIANVCSDQEPIPPERLVPSVPRDLSTICLKCLRKKKEARYGSAAELAEDLGRFLDGKTIRARRAGPVERLAKLIRRNRRVSALIGLVIASVVAGVAATLLYAQKAKRQEARASKNAELRFRALEKVLSTITGDRLRRAGQRPLQVQLIGDLLPQFEDVLRLEGEDPATRNLQGLAWVNLAVIRRDLGKVPEALEAAGNGEAIFRDLSGVPGFLDEASIGLATALSYKGTLLGLGGKFAQAIATLGEAAKLLGPYAGDEAPPLLERMGHIHNNWANCLMRSGGGSLESGEAADRHYREAVRYFGRGARTLPTCRDWQARTLSNLALLVEGVLKRPEEAIGLAQQAADLSRGLAVDLSKGLAAALSKDIDSRECLATCLTNLGELRMNHGDPAGSLPLFRDALVLYERLSAQVPDSFEFRWGIAMCLSDIGQDLALGPAEGRPQALEHLRRAEVLYRTLAAEDSENQELAQYIAINRERIAEIEAGQKPGP